VVVTVIVNKIIGLKKNSANIDGNAKVDDSASMTATRMTRSGCASATATAALVAMATAMAAMTTAMGAVAAMVKAVKTTIN
jgi:hypothetical protein